MKDKFENTVKMYSLNGNTIPDFEIEYASNTLKLPVNLINEIINKYN